MKNLKRYLFLPLSIALILSLSACQKEEGPSSVPNASESSVVQAENKEPSKAEESKEPESTKESKEPSEKESLPEEETSSSQESMDPSKESETSKEAPEQDPSETSEEDGKGLAKASPAPTPAPTASPSAKPETAPSEEPSAPPSEKPSEAPASAPTPVPTPESTPAPTEAPAPTQEPAPANPPENAPAPAPADTPAPVQSPEHQHNWEAQYLLSLDYLGNCMYDQVTMMICYGCGETYEDHYTRKIHYQQSNDETIGFVSPTCTEPGFSGTVIFRTYCDCGELNEERREEGVEIPPRGHSAGYKTYTTEIKQDENGKDLAHWYIYCGYCGMVMDEGWD